jgi:Stress responsive A/B Barrel Domain
MKNVLILLTMLLASVGAFAQTSKPAVSALQHVVLFKFKPETTPAKVAEIVAAFEALPKQIPTIRHFRWGTNNSPETHAKGLTHAFILTFDSAKDRDDYLPHPAHQAFGQLVGPWLADLTVVDFTEQK